MVRRMNDWRRNYGVDNLGLMTEEERYEIIYNSLRSMTEEEQVGIIGNVLKQMGERGRKKIMEILNSIEEEKKTVKRIMKAFKSDNLDQIEEAIKTVKDQESLLLDNPQVEKLMRSIFKKFMYEVIETEKQISKIKDSDNKTEPKTRLSQIKEILKKMFYTEISIYDKELINNMVAAATKGNDWLKNLLIKHLSNDMPIYFSSYSLTLNICLNKKIHKDPQMFDALIEKINYFVELQWNHSDTAEIMSAILKEHPPGKELDVINILDNILTNMIFDEKFFPRVEIKLYPYKVKIMDSFVGEEALKQYLWCKDEGVRNATIELITKHLEIVESTLIDATKCHSGAWKVRETSIGEREVAEVIKILARQSDQNYEVRKVLRKLEVEAKDPELKRMVSNAISQRNFIDPSKTTMPRIKEEGTLAPATGFGRIGLNTKRGQFNLAKKGKYHGSRRRFGLKTRQ